MSSEAYTTRPTRWLFSQTGNHGADIETEIRIQSEGAGEYVVVAQWAFGADGIGINPEMWPALSDTISYAMSHCLCSKSEFARSPVTAPQRLREIADLLEHAASRLGALAEQVSAASSWLVPEEHSTRANSLRRIAADYRGMACGVERRQQGVEVDDG